MNIEINKIATWLKTNKLSLNEAKTKTMVFRMPRKKIPPLKFIINDTCLEQIEHFTYLGLTIRHDLNWTHHVNKISNKISKNIGILNRLRHVFPQNILKLLYNSLVMPHINYCILAWGNTSSRITKLQKRAIRIINGSKYNAHTEPLFKTNNLLKVEDIYKLQLQKFFFKFVHNTLPMYYIKNDIIKKENKKHNVRNKKEFAIPIVKHEFAKKCIRYKAAVILNSTNLNIREKVYTHSLQGFTNYTKYQLINNYNEICIKANCYVCQNQ